MTLSSSELVSAGVVLLLVVTVAYGGTFVLRVTTGAQPTNDLQRSFFRAGHAHAAVLIILGLLVMVLVSSPGVPGWSRSGASQTGAWIRQRLAPETWSTKTSWTS